MHKITGLLIQALAYTIAILVAIFVGNYFIDLHPLWTVAIADLAGTLTIFGFSLILNNSSMYDPYWSVKPMVIAVYYFVLAGDRLDMRGILAGGLMVLYGLRLTSNFLRDWPGLSKEDWRYVDFREQYPKLYWLISFSGIHLFPTLLVYLACIPAYYAIVESDGGFGIWDVLGSIIFFGSILLSFVADEQMRRFREQATQSGLVMDLGLWRFSRHPNYLGEVLGWWGLWLFALGLSYAYYWTGIGATAITLLFYFISIPLMDNRSLKRRPNFKAYMEKTPSLFPRLFGHTNS